MLGPTPAITHAAVVLPYSIRKDHYLTTLECLFALESLDAGEMMRVPCSTGG